jgi:hypothetical protein
MIFIVGDPTGPKPIPPSGFALEKDLEALIETCPSALNGDADVATIRFVARQVRLGAGIADVVLLDSDMRLTLVEVKRGENAQARREVIGQAFDYVSALAEMTFEEVDGAMDGALASAIATFVDPAPLDENTAVAIDDLRRSCAANLRLGKIRVAVVVDEAPPDLLRIVGYLARRSGLDIRLATLARYVLEDGRIAVVPRLLVGSIGPREAEATDGATPQAYSDSLPVPWLKNFLDAFEWRSDEKEGNGKTTWRQIRVAGWPATIHYEVLARQRGLSIELHFERLEYRPVFDRVADELNSRQLGATVRLNPTWLKHGGAIILDLAAETPGADAAMTTRRFIDATKPLVAAQLARGFDH